MLTGQRFGRGVASPVSLASWRPRSLRRCRGWRMPAARCRMIQRTRGLFFALRWSCGCCETVADWRREDYARCIVTDGNLRLVVEPDGSAYRLQWTSTAAARRVAHDWRTLARCECLDDVRAALLCAYNVDGAGPVAPDLLAALASLPERAALGSGRCCLLRCSCSASGRRLLRPLQAFGRAMVASPPESGRCGHVGPGQGKGREPQLALPTAFSGPLLSILSLPD